MITERLKIWILLLVVAGCGTGTALAQKMVKVSGTVYNIAKTGKCLSRTSDGGCVCRQDRSRGRGYEEDTGQQRRRKHYCWTRKGKQPPTKTDIMKYWFRTTVR